MQKIIRLYEKPQAGETFIQYISRAVRVEPGATLKVPDGLLNFYGRVYMLCTSDGVQDRRAV